MNMNKTGFTCGEAKAIDLVDFLYFLGHQANKIRGKNYWYLSPLRTEKTPSFKVDRKLNLWYDHGIARGGTIIDFGVLYFGCSIPQFLQRLRDDFSFHQQRKLTAAPANETGVKSALKDRKSASEIKSENKKAGREETGIEIEYVAPISSLVLQRYLHSRNIPFSLANSWLQEVWFTIGQKQYYTLGFRNASGGFELRSAQFKGSASPKDLTIVERGNESINVFEGFFDFLSFLSIHGQKEHKTDSFLVLNSLSLIEKSISIFESFKQVRLFFDWDRAGRRETERLLAESESYVDESHLYKGYKDLNEWICGMGKKQKQVHKQKFG